MNKVAMVADGAYAWAQQHGLPLTKADLAAASAKCPIGQQQRPTLSPGHGILPQRGRLITLDLFHHGRGKVFLLLD